MSTTTGAPNIAHAKAWVEDARLQLLDFANDEDVAARAEEMRDVAATLADVANRAPLPVEHGAVVVMTESAIAAYHEAVQMIARAQRWAELMDGYDLSSVYEEGDGYARAEAEQARRRANVAQMELSLHRSLSHLATVAQDHDGPCVVTRDSEGSFYWRHTQSGYHGGVIFHANYADKGRERLPVGTWSIHT